MEWLPTLLPETAFAALGYFAIISLLSYFIPFLLQAFVLPARDFKKAYRTEWALVTGGSSGIGKALVEKLAQQGVNCVIAAMDDDLLSSTYSEMRQKYPAVEFRKCPVDLSGPDYLSTIVTATKYLRLNIVMSNAGYITTGLFADTSLELQLKNYEVNATAAVKIAHHFVKRWMDAGEKGFIGFTSSAAAYLPGPMAVMYTSTKAFLTAFATSLAAETRAFGIDILVVHPSPTDTRFYDKSNLSVLDFFQRTVVTPATVATCFFKSAGRFVVHDQGYFAWMTKVVVKLIDYNLLSDILARTSWANADFRRLRDLREKVRKKY